MDKEIIKYLSIYAFIPFYLAATYLGARQIFPVFYDQFVGQGINSVFAFFYACSSALQATKWVHVALVFTVLPWAWATKWLMERFGK
ncbi:MAG: hypothetical protein WC028_23520 [Candidatus Obscuribacterales bacterium]|jgi:hypothetical protein|nr:hypothetical protein [bacterium]